jgi:oligopeptide transport system permease protein
MSVVQPAMPQTAPVRGRSLSVDAWHRLKANKAAVASAVYLLLMALACIAGPWFAPNAYDDVFPEYVRTPASMEAYPRPPDIEASLQTALKRARLEPVNFQLGDDGRVSATITSDKPIDPRFVRYIERSDTFINSKIESQSADGTSLVLSAKVNRIYFYFGTDANGRDLMTRTLMAGRISLGIGLLAGFVAVTIGVVYGATAGFLGGRIDNVMMRFVDVVYSLPYIFFVILLVVFLGRSTVLMFLAVGAVEWLDMARIVRGQTLSIKRREYVEAAEALGVSTAGILRRHIIPNTLGPVVVYMTLLVPKVILIESFLSFLGLGVQEPATSWGVLISQGARNIEGATWMLLFPSIFLTTTLFALNFLGDGLRDALDPKER